MVYPCLVRIIEVRLMVIVSLKVMLPCTDVPAIVRDPRVGALVRDRFSGHRLSQTPDQEQRRLSQQPFEDASEVFERTPSHFIEALRAIVGHCMHQFELPRVGGLDIGSGATGAMVEDLMLPFINGRTWAQMDINPGSVDENRRCHSDSAQMIFKGSYLDLEGTLGLRSVLPIV